MVSRHIRALVAFVFVAACPFSYATVIGFVVGLDQSGGIGVANLSEAGVTLDSVSIDFSTNVQGDSFFDTTGNPPGDLTFLPWSVISSSGVNVILPDNATTDGVQVATIGFSSFDPFESVNIGVDFDTIGGSISGGGVLVGTTVTARYSTGDVVSVALLSEGGRTIGLFAYSFTALAQNVVPVSTVPEPSTFGLLAAGLLGLGWVRRRRSQS